MNNRITADELIQRGQEHWDTGYEHVSEFAVYLSRVHELSFMRSEKVMDTFGLSSTEFDVLASLRCSAPPHIMTPTELQRSMLITSGGLTKLLYQLEERDLISRSVQEKDKRSKLVHLTAEGKGIIEKSMMALLTDEDEWLKTVLNDKELKQLIKLLRKLNTALEDQLMKK